ncbi:hypothetical protein Tco_1319480 [Tanacetum coccineum]
MTTLKFDDTHNMVVFLSKPAESEGFEQIVDFLNAHPIKHALTVNPTIYTSCIKQFWATVKAKTINGEVQLQALMDGKKIIITESTMTVYKELDDSLVRAAITASSLEAEHSDEGLGEEDASKQGRIADIDANKDIYLVNVHTDEDMFGVNKLICWLVLLKKTVNAACYNNYTASTIPVIELKSAKPKADKIVIQEPEHGTTTTTPTTIIHVPKPLHDKGKGIMIEEPVVEQVKPMKRLEQIRLDEELIFKLQAEEEEEERLAREKAQQIEEASISWDDVQAKIEADY